MRILVVNAGSSSLKLSVIDDGDQLLAAADVAAGDAARTGDTLRMMIARHGPIAVVGHRVVHGGTEFVEPVLLDRKVLQRLRALTDLAPLHLPRSLDAIDVVARAMPDVPAIACFDTAFHASMPRAATTYALPVEWRARWPLRRFGFHGLSHAWASSRVAALMQTPIEQLRIVTCHLGAGASLCAVRAGRSVDTTMGFTPLEGLVMATRSGSVDPGLVLWLQERAAVSTAELADTLERRSGLLALAGNADMREVVAAAARGDDGASLALDVYVHRLRASVAAMAAAMQGLDAVVFTGGVGERSAEIRARAAAGLAFLGVHLDAERNAGAQSDGEIGDVAAATRAFVITAREDLQIAAAARRLVRTLDIGTVR